MEAAASSEGTCTPPEECTCAQCGMQVSAQEAIRVHSKRAIAKTPSMYKCKACNALESRISRLKSTLNFEVSWGTQEDKSEFFKKHTRSFGPALRTALEQSHSESVSRCSIERLAEEGNWLDEEDLRERYKSKPEQLRNMLASARQITHPTRKCTLYLDTNFRFSSSNETSHREETKRVSYSEDAQEAPPQPKKKARVDDPTTKSGKPLTDKQRVALQAAAAKSRASAEKELAWLQDEGL